MDKNSLCIAMIPKAKKHLWQNFLRNPKILQKIVGDDSLESINIVEVGPGPGDLTNAILHQKPKSLSLIEIDGDMIPLLKERFRDTDIILYHNDVLNMDISSGTSQKRIQWFHVSKDTTIHLWDYRVYGNIPYYITSPILHHFLYDVNSAPESLVFTMQKEVADRILARDGVHSVLSLSCHLVSTPIKICDISPDNFVPAPKVWSTCLKFDLNKEDRNTLKELLSIIKLWFSQKRKKLLSNLSQTYKKEEIQTCFNQLHISENARAEELSIDQWKELYKLMKPS